MKTKNAINPAILLTTAFVAIFTTTSAFATELVHVQHPTVYQFTKDKSLAKALSQLALSDGILFKIKINVNKNVVSQNIVANDWHSAIKELLIEYNYTIIQDGETKAVIISGHNGNAPDEPKAMLRSQL